MNEPPTLDEWCERWLGARPVETLFDLDQTSRVLGLRLADWREVVVKIRLHDTDRVAGCFEVQRRLWDGGYPCPQPLVGPAPLGSGVATAEALVTGGEMRGPTSDSPRLFGEALADLVARAPAPAHPESLEPAPVWARWNHVEEGTWPLEPGWLTNLNEHSGPAWLDDAAWRARNRLLAADLPAIIGHTDFESQNTRWRGDTLHVVFDWDSLAVQSEAAIAGLACSMFTVTIEPRTEATLDQSSAFLDAYERARGRRWTSDEVEVAWAASVWIRAWDAKRRSLTPDRHQTAPALSAEVEERLRLAGA